MESLGPVFNRSIQNIEDKGLNDIVKAIRSFNQANYLLTNHQFSKLDLQMAINLYKHAAELGHVEAALKIGKYILANNNVLEAIDHFEKWIGRTSGEVERLLGNIYSSDTWGVKDLRKGIDFYKIAADDGCEMAQVTLADLLYYGKSIVVKDRIQAKKWYEEAANQGNSRAKYFLAKMLLKAEGGERLEERGLNLLKSIENDNINSLELLAKIYLDGKYEVGENISLGMRYLRKASTLKSSWALKRLAKESYKQIDI